VGATAKSYTDSTDATTLASAKSYTDTETTNRTAAVATVTTNLNNEITRATGAENTLTTNLNSEISTRGTQIGNLQVTTPNGASIVTPPVGGSTTTYTSTTSALQSLQNQIGKLNGSGFNDMKTYVDSTFATTANAVTTATLNSTIGSLTAANGTTYTSVRAYLDATTASDLNLTPATSTTPICIATTAGAAAAGTPPITTCGVSANGTIWQSISDIQIQITMPANSASRKVLVVGSINVQATGLTFFDNTGGNKLLPNTGAVAARLAVNGNPVTGTDNTFTLTATHSGIGIIAAGTAQPSDEVVIPITATLTIAANNTGSPRTDTISVQWANTDGGVNATYFFSTKRALSATSGN
jgi:hypothetical protein